MTFSFQLYSDLHLEFYKEYPRIPCLKKYLILAGDIGKINTTCFHAFLDYCNSKWEKVFYVLGNHEFYHFDKTIEELEQDYETLFHRYENIELLHRKKSNIEDWTLLGCTLWSFYDNELPDDCINCLSSMKKRDNITGETISLHKTDYNYLHTNDKKWLLQNYNPNEKTIIITHYPLQYEGTSHPIHINKKKEEKLLFANHINLDPKNTLVCISGHTHFSYDFMNNNIRYISNQFGYKDELQRQMTYIKTDGCFHIS